MVSRDAPDLGSQNSENKSRLARPVNLPIFVTLWQTVCEISAVENLCSSIKWTKVQQNRLRPANERTLAARISSEWDEIWQIGRGALLYITQIGELLPKRFPWGAEKVRMYKKFVTLFSYTNWPI